MSDQLYFEDIQAGMEVTPLVKNPSTRQLVMWAGASGDFNEIHYDQEHARSTGLPDIIVHGRLKGAFLIQMLTDWIGARGTLRKFNVRYREVDIPRKQMVCRGKVTAVSVRDGQHWVEGEAWTEDLEGRQTTTATFVATVPSRS